MDRYILKVQPEETVFDMIHENLKVCRKKLASTTEIIDSVRRASSLSSFPIMNQGMLYFQFLKFK